ncbi:hypothetical protein [Nocardiopsis potens]|uniref:hypothetical protein n=1 Tax=Nocardiopsis potens TaxID=1246458 RepID=UPI00034C7B2B|nr:hypothetical protein [Nocardiopsis potens]
MPLTHPLLLPAAHLFPSGGPPAETIGFKHLAAAFSESGDCYVLSGFARMVAGLERYINGQLVTRYRPDGTPAGCLVIRLTAVEEGDESSSGIRGHATDLCVLPDGAVALSSPDNRTFLVDADLTGLAGTWDGNYGRAAGEFRPDVPEHIKSSFAAMIRPTPSGRLLCVLSEFEMSMVAGGVLNLIGTARGPLTPDHRPEVDVFACLRLPDGPGPNRSLPIPYTSYAGAPAGGEHRPGPGLAAEARARWPELRWFRPRLGAPAVVAEDRYLVPVFDAFRPDRWSEYVYALVDGSGALVGRLDGPGKGKSSPFPGEHYEVAADPERGRVFHVNESGLYVWSAEGERLAALPAADKAYRALKRMHLMGCAPDGSLLLARHDHNLLLRIEVPDDLDRLGPAVEAALSDHVRTRNRLKKAHTPVDWLWTTPDAPVFL